jgi:hypothetical protein
MKIPDKTIPPGGNRFTLMQLRPDLTPACWFRKKSRATDVMGRLEWDKPALTIRTEFFKPEKVRYLHPEQHRPITHWEAARIQTFPDDFKFFGSKIEIARQIGNAVPPKLAEAVATELKRIRLYGDSPKRDSPAGSYTGVPRRTEVPAAEGAERRYSRRAVEVSGVQLDLQPSQPPARRMPGSRDRGRSTESAILASSRECQGGGGAR